MNMYAEVSISGLWNVVWKWKWFGVALVGMSCGAFSRDR